MVNASPQRLHALDAADILRRWRLHWRYSSSSSTLIGTILNGAQGNASWRPKTSSPSLPQATA